MEFGRGHRKIVLHGGNELLGLITREQERI